MTNDVSQALPAVIDNESMTRSEEQKKAFLCYGGVSVPILGIFNLSRGKSLEPLLREQRTKKRLIAETEI